MGQEKSWYEKGGSSSEPSIKHDLYASLDYARNHALKHMEWFQKHRDATQSQIGLVITAEILIIRFFVADYKLLGFLVLPLLGFVSILLGQAGCKSCERAYKAGLEHSHMVAKIMYALFPEGGVKVETISNNSYIPGKTDSTLFVKRYLKEAVEDCENYSEVQITVTDSQGYKNTLGFAKRVIKALAYSSAALGFLGAVFVLLK